MNEEESAKILDTAEPIAEVTEEVTDVVETQQEKEVEFTDTAENSTDTAEKPADNVEKPKESETQTSEENAKFAQIRRKAEEEAQKKIEFETKKAYEKGKLEAYKGKTNPYTERAIEDLIDVEIYETMAQLESEGKDPVKDLPYEIARKQKEREEEKQRRVELEKQTQKEVIEFQEKYPNVDLTALLNDEMFSDYIQGKNKPIIELYEGFNKLKNSFRTTAVQAAKQTIANAQASPGSLGGDADVTIDYNTMSAEEFNKRIEMVKNGELK